MMCNKRPCGRHEFRSEDERLAHNLRRCFGHLRHHAEDKGSQRRVLFLLRRHGSMTQKELLQTMDVRAGSLSELLSKLEAKGCITKEKCESDKRNYNVTITEAGLALLEELQQQYNASIVALLSGISEEDKTELNRLLEKLHDSWSHEKQKG